MKKEQKNKNNYSKNMREEYKKCYLCKKDIKGDWCYSGQYYHEKCKEKDSADRIKDFLKNKKCK